MKNFKLVGILRTFSKNEMKEFEKFISHPLYSKGRNYKPFFSQLKKFYPAFDDPKLTPEYIFSKLFPGKKYNSQMLWNMTSKLMILAEEYLVHQSLKRNRFQRESLASDEYLERKLPDFYERKLKSAESILEGSGIDDHYFRNKTIVEDGWLNLHLIEDTQQLLTEHILKKGEYSVLNFLREITDIIGALRVGFSMYNIPYKDSIPYRFVQNAGIREIVEYARAQKFKYAGIMEMYYESIMLSMEYEEPGHFFRVIELFEENFESFPMEEKFLWASELTNYCTQKLNDGDYTFVRASFELDKFKLKEGIAYIKRNIPKLMFTQVLGNALFLGEIEWGKKFIDEYAPKLKASYQKSMHALGYAFINFRQKNYDKVLEYLGKVNFIDGLDKLHVRALYIRTYFEMNETETLLNYMDATRHFLDKNPSISNKLRDNHQKFLACMRRLVQAIESKDKFELKKLREHLAADNSISYNVWICQKIDEMKI